MPRRFYLDSQDIRLLKYLIRSCVMSLVVILTISACSLALILVGGGLYEFLVVDPFWPRRPDLIQPDRGGISRKRFWIPAHVSFELALIASLILAWPYQPLRSWLWIALI